jgi:UTP:GlnB (protein PII) uridylyltransferase
MYSYSFEETDDLLESPGAAPERIGSHLHIADGAVRFVDPVKAASLPMVWVEAFRVAMARGCAVSSQAQQVIRQHVGRHSPDDFVATRGDRTQLRKLLHPRPGLHARLVEMRRAGLLPAIFPEPADAPRQGAAPAHVVHAVDDRDLAPIARLESMRLAKAGASGRFRAMLDEVHAPELLTIALLFDRCAGAGDHEDRAAAVRPALARLQLPADAHQAVEFLVSRRQDVTRLAHYRDRSDPAVVEALVRLAATDQQLKMICLVALAHAQADAARSNEWADEQLWRLFVEARQRLMLGANATLLLQDQASRAVAIAGRPDDISEAELTQFLDSVGNRYLAAFGIAEAYEHVRQVRRLRPADVLTALERHDGTWRLTIVNLQVPQIFYRAVSVLARFGLDIHRARRITTPDDLAIDLFEFSDTRGVLSRTPSAASHLERALRSLTEGVDVEDVADLRPHMPAEPRAPSAVSVRHDPADPQTIVDVTSSEGRELLPRLCSVIAELGGDVDLALVIPEGDGTRAVLHTTKHGRRLSEADRVELSERVGFGTLQPVTCNGRGATNRDQDVALGT